MDSSSLFDAFPSSLVFGGGFAVDFLARCRCLCCPPFCGCLGSLLLFLFNEGDGCIEALEEFSHIVSKDYNGVTVKVLSIPALAFHHLEKDVSVSIFLYIKKIGPVLETLCGAWW